MSESVVAVRYASFSRRLAAAFLDGVLLTLPGFLANSILPVAGSLILYFLYAPLLECSPARATWGKKVMGIEVTTLDGKTLTLQAAFLRSAIRLGSTVIFFLGAFFAFFSSKKQMAHDLFTQSVVVHRSHELNQDLFNVWKEALTSFFSKLSQMTNDSSYRENREKNSSFNLAEEMNVVQELRNSGKISSEEYEKRVQSLLLKQRSQAEGHQ